MKGTRRFTFLTMAAVLVCYTNARGDVQVGPAPRAVESVSLLQPKKEPPKLPKKEFKIEMKKEPGKFAEFREVRVNVTGYGPYGIAYGYWPGPVLPGMWGGVYGGLWPDSRWMGGPYLYSGWVGSWGRGWGYGGGGCGCCCCGGGAWPLLLPPVFGPVAYPAVSPYWVPRVAPFWMVPAAAWPHVVAIEDSKPRHENRPVPTSANADKLYADALWLFFDGDFKSACDHLAAAIKKAPSDARFWYYKALAERALGEEQAAHQSAVNGAALEITIATDKRVILTALERIQGKDRAFLNDLVSGPKALSLHAAGEIVANLKSGNATTLTSAK